MNKRTYIHTNGQMERQKLYTPQHTRFINTKSKDNLTLHHMGNIFIRRDSLTESYLYISVFNNVQFLQCQGMLWIIDISQQVWKKADKMGLICSRNLKAKISHLCQERFVEKLKPWLKKSEDWSKYSILAGFSTWWYFKALQTKIKQVDQGDNDCLPKSKHALCQLKQTVYPLDKHVVLIKCCTVPHTAQRKLLWVWIIWDGDPSAIRINI